MTDFTLKTQTERVMYVEALFQCLDRRVISEADARRDIRDMIADITASSVTALSVASDEHERLRLITHQVSDVMSAYVSGAMPHQAARDAIVELLSGAALDPAFLKPTPALMDA